MNREVELKLEIAPRDAARLRAHPLLEGRQPRIEQQHSVYFDTAKGKLRRNGWALRVRQSGEHYTQTIKRAGDGAGLFDRDEWEAGVPSLIPDAAAAAETPLKDVLGPRQFRKLVPVFRTDVERSTWLVEGGGAEVELVSDCGEIAAGVALEPVHELELELKHGDVAALFDAARQLAEQIPFRLGVLSKAERGFALTDGRQVSAEKAGPVVVDASMSVADAFAAIASACLKHFRMNEKLMAEGHAEALHQARVAMRRLRSALWMFRPAIKDGEFAGVRDALRDFTRQMGTARNLDVFLASLKPGDARRRRLGRECRRHYAEIAKTLESQQFRNFMLTLFAWTHCGEWREGKRAETTLMDFAIKRLDRLWWAIEGRGAELASLSEDERHRLRIDAKKIRYALEFLHEPLVGVGSGQRKFAGAAEGLQETLGLINDLVTAGTFGAGSREANAQADQEAQLLRVTARYLRQMRNVGPYWHEAGVA